MFPMQFMLRSHSTFLAAGLCAMAGQAYESTVLQRSCLETAAYGLFIGCDHERAKTWLGRHDSKEATADVRNAFSFGKIKRHLEKAHADIAPQFEMLYESTIDFGAHPNERGFSSNIKVRREKERRVFDTIYLHEDGPQLDFALKGAGQVGLWSLLAFQKLYPARYDEMGVGGELTALKAIY